MQITTLASAPKVPFDLEGYVMYASPELEIVHLVIRPGQQIAIHTNPFDVIMIPVEGRLAVVTENQEYLPGLYDSIEIAAGVQRGISNVAECVSRVLIIKKFA